MRLLVPALILLPLGWAHAQTPAGNGKGTVREKGGPALVPSAGSRSQRCRPGVTTSTNPIDAFIAADYKAKGLLPAGKADKLTLLRRVYLDLIGLPPTAAEQEAFLADSAPDAYEKTVDRLLDSEQHGVRWSRYWLDVLRYADLDGLDGSVMPAAPGIYLWRDWVIKALNHDMPYDQFVRAQILGNRYRPETVDRFERPPCARGRQRGGLVRSRLSRAVGRHPQRSGSRHPLRRGGDDFDRVHGHDRRLRQVPRP